jgi:hypothetical protein
MRMYALPVYLEERFGFGWRDEPHDVWRFNEQIPGYRLGR